MIIHISDPHFTNSKETLDSDPITRVRRDSQNSRLKSALLSEYLIENRARFDGAPIVITGDITDSGDEEDYVIAREFVTGLRAAGFAVHVTPGNHDYCKEGMLLLRTEHETGQARDRFRKYVSGSSERYPIVIPCSFGRLVLLDSMQGELEDWEHADNAAQGKLGSAQLAALRVAVDEYQQERSNGKLLVLALHHSPFHTPENDAAGCLSDAAAFRSIVSGKVDVILFGHTTNAGNLQESFDGPLPGEPTPDARMVNCENLEHAAWGPPIAIGRGSHVCAGVDRDGRVEAIFVGPDSRLYHSRQPLPDRAGQPPRWDKPWSAPERIGGAAYQACVAQNQDGTLEALYLGMDGRVHSVRQATAGGAWGAPIDLGGRWVGDHELSDGLELGQIICAERDAAGCLEVFYAGPDFRVQRQRQSAPGGTWAAPSQLDGYATHLDIARHLTGELELFAIGSMNRIYRYSQAAGSWSSAIRLGGTAQQLSVVCKDDDLLEAYYVGMNSGVYRLAQTRARDWEPDQRLQGEALQIVAAKNGDGRLAIFYIGHPTTQVYQNYQLEGGKGWAGQEMLWGSSVLGAQLCLARDRDKCLQVFYVGYGRETPRGDRIPAQLRVIAQTQPNAAYAVTIIDTPGLARTVEYVG